MSAAVESHAWPPIERVWSGPRSARALSTGSARDLLLTVLGELALAHDGTVWTAALLHVMTGLGHEEQTARQAIARAADSGLMLSERHGRTVRWTISDTGRAKIDSIAARAASLVDPPAQWDGRCLVVAVTIPQRLRTARKRLYTGLRWQGFGNPAPGLWASPHVDRVEELRALIDDLGLRDSTITFIGSTLGVGLTDDEIVRRAWDLDEIAASYHKLIADFADLRPAPGDDLLFTYLALVTEYHRFPAIDPQLPHDLLPDWVGRRASAMFLQLRQRWTGPAHARWLEIVEATAGRA